MLCRGAGRWGQPSFPHCSRPNHLVSASRCVASFTRMQRTHGPPAGRWRWRRCWPLPAAGPADQGTSALTDRGGGQRGPARRPRRRWRAPGPTTTPHGTTRRSPPRSRRRACTRDFAAAHHRSSRPRALSVHRRPGRLVAGARRTPDVDPAALELRDRMDLVIGLGETLFFDEHYRAAADFFESTLDHGQLLGTGGARPGARLVGHGGRSPRARRCRPAIAAEAFDRLIARMEGGAPPRAATSAAAAYWLAAAAFARGHVDRAWNAAIAGYVRGLLATQTAARRSAPISIVWSAKRSSPSASADFPSPARPKPNRPRRDC